MFTIMRKTALFLSLIIFTILSSCKKDSTNSGVNINPSSSNKIVITNLQFSSDSVVLTWTKLTNKNFRAYYILRRNYKSTNPNSFTGSDIIDEIYDASVVKFADNNFPVAPYLEYEVVGLISDSLTYNYSYIYSNVMPFERSGLKTFYFNPIDVIPDIPNHLFYVIEADSGKISIVDYTARSIVKAIKTNATIGYCALGTYNGVKEIYVPRNDGWVFIYNAVTLAKIDQISSGSSCGAVLFNNGKLFVFGNSNDYYTSMNVIDRATKSVISTISNLYYMRPKLVPGSNTKIFGVASSYSSSGDLYSFEFDASGNVLNHSENYVDYPSDYHSFEIFPDGQHFITSEYGAIYASDLSYVVQLPYGDYNYSGFAFSGSASKIVAGCNNYKDIITYSNPGYSELQAYQTQGYPAFIFNDNDTIISLSSTTIYNYYNEGYNFLIEAIPLTSKAKHK